VKWCEWVDIERGTLPVHRVKKHPKRKDVAQRIMLARTPILLTLYGVQQFRTFKLSRRGSEQIQSKADFSRSLLVRGEGRRFPSPGSPPVCRVSLCTLLREEDRTRFRQISDLFVFPNSISNSQSSAYQSQPPRNHASNPRA
jgi:hypothetical protein